MLEAILLAALVADGPAPDRGEALRDAARAGDLATVTRLLDAGVPVDAKAPRHGQTPLLFAAGEGRLDVVRLLVERGADVNARETLLRPDAALVVARRPARRSAPGGRAVPAVEGRGRRGRGARRGRRARATSSWRRRRSRPDAWSRSSWRPRAWRRTRRRRSPPRSAGAARVARRPRRRSARRTRSRRTRSKKYAGRYRGGQRTEATVAVRGNGLVITAERAPELVRRADRRGSVRERGRRRRRSRFWRTRGHDRGPRASTARASVTRFGRRHGRSRAAQAGGGTRARHGCPARARAAVAAVPRPAGVRRRRRPGRARDLGRREGRERALQDAAARALALAARSCGATASS